MNISTSPKTVQDLDDAPPAKNHNLFDQVNELRKAKAPTAVDENAKYKKDFFGMIARNKYFEGTTFFFIGMNSVYIGVDADYSATTGKPDDLYDPGTPMGFVFMENLFCVYFTGEVIIRFIAFRRKRDCAKDGWFVFDSTLVTLMVLETWIFPIFGLGGQLAQLSVLRLLRLLRISRMARLMRKVPELMIIIKGMIASFRSVACTGILQVLILYVWSILFVSEYHEAGSEDPESADDGHIKCYFGTMGKSMFSLFIYGTILDDVTQVTDIIRGVEGNYVFMLGLFIMFILISSFTLLNMLIGILCEVVSATAESEKTKAAEACVKEAMTTLFDKLDMDGNGTVSEEEFIGMRDDEEVFNALQEMDICETHFNRYCEILFHRTDDQGEKVKLDFETIINMILRLSPGNHVNALDFSLLQASVDGTQESLRHRIKTIHALIEHWTRGGGPLPPTGLEEGDDSRPPSRDMARKSSKESLDSKDKASNAVVLPLSPPIAKLAPAPPEEPFGANSKWSLDMFVRTSSHEIIQELERRLGVSGVPQEHVKELRSAAQAEEAFHSLGVPELPSSFDAELQELAGPAD